MSVLSGLDRLDEYAALLNGSRIALMTNPTGVDRRLRSCVSIIGGRYNLTALFACEHGVRGNLQAGDYVESYVDDETGVTVYSLYGSSPRMTPEMLDAFDVFVFDMQDVGARFYTYLYSLAYAMEDCAAAGKRVVVLDRPNPLGGETVQGTLLDERFASFVGMYAMPTRYGLTIGEYARWLRDYRRLGLELDVVPLAGWERRMYHADTGLQWIAPSPNIPTPTTALVYSGTCVFEGTNLSEGRGTTQPFELIGAPWLNGAELARRMNALLNNNNRPAITGLSHAERKSVAGLLFRPVYFTPTFSKHQGELCSGVQMHVIDPRVANPFAAALYMLQAIAGMHPDQFALLSRGEAEQGAAAQMKADLLLGADAIDMGHMDIQGLIETHEPLVRHYQEMTRVYRLYE
ncbi:MAG: DUF1343 domain-containing protein [Oscillospiraceae bacterium]|jgi:uncharacterized protein YbbC (DUF1343 family)|nr:DUF1343 domain-containing protein [Oscillospiraceae bacterium]